jgi:formylglycine-generating enzyme required for sulfatase activity
MKQLSLTLVAICGIASLSGQSPDKRTFALRKMVALIDTAQAGLPADYSALRAHLPEMIAIDGGSYTAGCTPEQGAECKTERPPREVSVGSFKLTKTEITNAQYCQFLNACHVDGYGWYNNRRLMDIFDVNIQISYVGKQWQPKRGYENHPMVCVTWFGAEAYCTAAGGRLPTATEWEFAARGGNKSGKYKYAGGNTLKQTAWHAANSANHSHPVAKLQPNELGLYDMSGNVWEWCSDVFAAEVADGNDDDDSEKDDYLPDATDEEVVRILCGGCWYDDEQYCRVSFRDGTIAGTSDNGNGFRMAMDVS